MSPPQLGHRSPPVLVDDAMRETFLRVPPDDPATLARASAVCTAWRGIISDADFGRQYRAFHGAPPVLGFLYNCYYGHTSHFISTTASSRSPACHDREDWWALDSRHGLVLFHSHHDSWGIRDLAVCDIITHDWWSVPAHPSPEWSDVNRRWKAAVLCDHRDSSQGAFLVALVGSNNRAIFASVYSSEAGEWSDTISIEKRNAYQYHNVEVEHTGHSAVVGNKVYVPCGGSSLVEYEMVVQELVVINVQALLRSNFLVGAEDGSLLFATVDDEVLRLWWMEPGLDFTAVKRRVIDLEPLLPRNAISCEVSVVGFAEGAGAIFLRADETDALYTVELSSRRTKKIHCAIPSDKVMPYMSFYTGGHGERGRRALVGATRRWAGLLWLYGENLP
ncbi:unnamed protein product [Alopecurus aequalis]